MVVFGVQTVVSTKTVIVGKGLKVNALHEQYLENWSLNGSVIDHVDHYNTVVNQDQQRAHYRKWLLLLILQVALLHIGKILHTQLGILPHCPWSSILVHSE